MSLKKIIIILLATLIPALGLGDIILAQPSITARVDRTSLAVGEQLLLTVTIMGEVPNLPPPNVSSMQDFVVVSSSTSRQVSVVNGKMSSEGVFTYILQPLRAGLLTIPPIGVAIEGQLYETAPIKVEVSGGATPAPPVNENVPAPTPDTSEEQNLFVEADVDNPNPYLGQQIIYIFRFYQAADFPLSISGRLDYQAPAFTDFWSQTLAQPQYTTRIRGRSYTVTEVQTALFPAGLNAITIEPARLVVPGGLFNPDIVLETAPIVVTVNSLPDGAPPAFNGAVGQFELRAHVDTNNTQVNDTVTLVLEIEGAGNVDALTEPALPELSGWRFFESQPSTNMLSRENQVYGIRRFERLMVPGQAGEFIIPSFRFSYYDPEAGEYRTSTTDPIPITVHPGEDAFDGVAEPIDPIISELRDIKAVPVSLDRSRFFSLANPIYWFCWILPLFVVGAIWVFHNQRQRLLTDTGYARRLRAKRIAHRSLKKGRGEADDYATAHRVLLGYLSDKLNRPTAGLTSEALVNLLVEEGVDADLVSRIKSILNQVETSRFAPIEKTAARSLLKETRKLINKLEKSFGKR